MARLLSIILRWPASVARVWCCYSEDFKSAIVAGNVHALPETGSSCVVEMTYAFITLSYHSHSLPYILSLQTRTKGSIDAFS